MRQRLVGKKFGEGRYAGDCADDAQFFAGLCFACLGVGLAQDGQKESLLVHSGNPEGHVADGVAGHVVHGDGDQVDHGQVVGVADLDSLELGIGLGVVDGEAPKGDRLGMLSGAQYVATGLCCEGKHAGLPPVLDVESAAKGNFDLIF